MLYLCDINNGINIQSNRYYTEQYKYPVKYNY